MKKHHHDDDDADDDNDDEDIDIRVVKQKRKGEKMSKNRED